MATKEDAELVAQRVRAIAEESVEQRSETRRLKRAVLLRIPLEDVGASGVSVALSETGAHFCVKV